MTSSSTYPASLDTFNVAIDGAKTLADASQKHSEVHDWVGAALNKIEAELGVNPSGAAADVAAAIVASSTPADNSVTSAKIVDGTIVNADLRDGTITSAKIASKTIGYAQIADGAIGDAQINVGAAITPSKLNCPADVAKVLRGDGTWAKIGYAQIADGAIGDAQINVGAAIASSKVTGVGFDDASATDPLSVVLGNIASRLAAHGI